MGVDVNMWCDVMLEVGLCDSDNEFISKIRAVHCTPLEFRTGFLAGGF